MFKILHKVVRHVCKKPDSIVAPKAMQEAFTSGGIRTANHGVFAQLRQKAVKPDNVGNSVDTLS